MQSVECVSQSGMEKPQPYEMSLSKNALIILGYRYTETCRPGLQGDHSVGADIAVTVDVIGKFKRITASVVAQEACGQHQSHNAFAALMYS